MVRMLGALALLVAFQAGAQAPVSYTMTITTDSGTGRPEVSVEHVKAANGMVRLEMVPGDSAVRALMAGSYMLLAESSDTIVTVLPSSHMMVSRSSTASPFPPGLVAMHRTGAPGLEVEDLGDGPVIAGLPTHHYRVTIDGDVEVTVDTTHCNRHVHVVTDTWNATGVELPDLLTKRFVAGVMQGVGAQRAAESAALLAQQPPGVALRKESVAEGVTSRVEVSDIRHEAIDPSVFALPTGYTMMDPTVMTRMMDNPAMRANIASVLKARMCRP